MAEGPPTAQRSISLSHLLKSLAPGSSALASGSSSQEPQRLGPSPLVTSTSSSAVGSLAGLLKQSIEPVRGPRSPLRHSLPPATPATPERTILPPDEILAQLETSSEDHSREHSPDGEDRKEIDSALLDLPLSLSIYGSPDPVAVWTTVSARLRRPRGRRRRRPSASLEEDLAEAMRSPSGGVRSRSLSRARHTGEDDDFAITAAVLAACIKVHVEAEDEENPAGGGGSGAATLVFWDAIRGLVADVARIPALVELLSSLSRGGRAVYPLSGAADLLCEWTTALFDLQERARRRLVGSTGTTGALTDAHRQTPLIRKAELHNPALSLLILMHKFSCPQLSAAEVSRCTEAVVSVASSTTGERDVASCLTFVDTVVTFGYVPPEHLRDVVCLVARVVGLEGAGGDVELVSQAQATMRNLIRSPANQAIRSLRSILTHCADDGSESAAVDLPLVVGAIRSLDHALADNDKDLATYSAGSAADGQSSGATALLTLDLPVLAPQLQVAMSCGVPEVDAEVLAFVDARLAVGQARHARVEDAGSDMWDLWDATLDLMQIAGQRVETWHEKRPSWCLTSDGPARIAPDSTADPTEAALASFASIFDRLVEAHERGQTPGPTGKLTALYLQICAFLDDSLGVRLLAHCVRDQVCVPEEELWIANLDKLVRAFIFGRESAPVELHLGKSSLSSSVRKSGRPACPQTRMQVMLLVRDTYASVRDLEEWKEPLVEVVIAPLLGAIFSGEADPSIVDAGAEILRNVAHDELLDSLVTDEGSSTAESDVFDRLHRLLFSVASSATKPEARIQSSPAKSARVSPQQEHATHQAVLALIGMFNDALTIASRYAVVKCVPLFRNLLSLLSPSVANPAESLHELSHDLKPLAEPLPVKTRLALLQWMVRLRADQEHRIQFIRDLDVSGLAALLQRTTSPETATSTPAPLVPDSPADRRGRVGRTPNNDATPSPDRGWSSIRGRTPSTARSFRRERSASKQRKPAASAGLWGLPEHLPDASWPAEISPESSRSLVAFDHQKMYDWQEAVDSAAVDMPPVSVPGAGMVVLPVSEYLAAIIRILRYEDDWELVSYVLCYLPDQLSNKHFACGPRAAQQIHQLRRLLCGGIIRDTLIDQVSLPGTIKRTDAHAVAYQLLATLIAYRSLFDKSQQDEMVAAFARGLRTAGNTAKACIHAIAMACHELEPSVRKFLPEILTSLARILSTASVSVHILELIATMAQIPQLYANLTETDFQTVFGIAIQYISNHNQQRLDDAAKAQTNAPPTGQEVDEAVAVMSAFQQYVYLMAYYIIAVWFVSLRLPERRRYVTFIVGKLISACHGHSFVDEAAEVCLDMIARYTYANAEPRPRPSLYADTIASALGNPVVEKSWMLGNAIISIKSLSRPGWAEVCVRRPSGIVRMMWELENLGGSVAASEMDVLNMVLRHRDTVLEPPVEAAQTPVNARAGRRRAASYSGARASVPIGMALERLTLETVLARSAQAAQSGHSASFTELVVDPSFFQLQMSPYPDFPAYRLPIRVPDEPAYKRLISSIDYVPVVDFHKVSVLYVGPGQTTEREILGNVHGSKTYVRFLTALGDLVQLKGCRTHYTGGLDTENDLNGRWTYVWDDDITQIVFHVATLMPSHPATDPDSIAKKALIGNDFVSIVFNDSGKDYRFDTVRSQFNFLNVIIEPHTPAGMAWSAPGMTNNIEFFKVSLQRRAGLPEIGPVGNFKMVSTASLPHFVRQLSLHANIFSQVYLATVGVKTAEDRPRHRIEYVSHWRERLRQIRTLRNRIRPGDTVEGTAEAGGAAARGQAIDVGALSSARDFTAWTL